MPKTLFRRFDSRSYTHASRVCRVLALCSVLGVGVPYRTVPDAVTNSSSNGRTVEFYRMLAPMKKQCSKQTNCFVFANVSTRI